LDRDDLERVEAIFRATGANVAVPDDIKLKIWEKFSFISPMATATAALNSSVSDILNDDKKSTVLNALMEEVVTVAGAEGVILPDHIIEINRGKLSKLPAGATSSMHNDFRNNKKTELEDLTGYVVRQAQHYNIAVPAYAEQYTRLKERAGYA
jgi:2-dehydropantoate 2-reductase